MRRADIKEIRKGGRMTLDLAIEMVAIALKRATSWIKTRTEGDRGVRELWRC